MANQVDGLQHGRLARTVGANQTGQALEPDLGSFVGSDAFDEDLADHAADVTSSPSELAAAFDFEVAVHHFDGEAVGFDVEDLGSLPFEFFVGLAAGGEVAVGGGDF